MNNAFGLGSFVGFAIGITVGIFVFALVRPIIPPSGEDCLRCEVRCAVGVRK